MKLKIRSHFGVLTVHTSPRRGRGACTGNGQVGTYEGTLSYESLDSLQQTMFIYVSGGAGVQAQFRTRSQKIVGIFKSEQSTQVILNLKGAFTFA